MRSFLSVVAGFVTWTFLWMASNAALMAAVPGSFAEDGSTDSVGILVLMLTYSTLYSVASGFVTGVVAKEREVFHAAVLGVLLLIVGGFVQSQYWDTAPVWYHLIFLGQLLPAATLGGYLRSLRGQA